MRFDDSIEVVLNDKLLKSYKLEGVLNSPNQPIAVAAFSEKSNNIHILRLFLLNGKVNSDFNVSHEIEAFSFTSRKELKSFLQKLPQISAIDLLLLMNPQINERIS